jgi:multiple sugar transport system ATP-binding protein
MTMGDKVAVMRRGELQQFGSPEDIYGAPANVFVAGFIGSPPMNLVEGRVQEEKQDGYMVEIGSERVRVEPDELAHAPQLSRFVGRSVVVGIRPERLEDSALASDTPPERRISGIVNIREALGSDVLIHFRIAGPRTQLSPEMYGLVHDVEDAAELVDLTMGEGGAVFIGRFSPQSAAREGESIEVSLRPRALQFFDPDTGYAISERSVNGARSTDVQPSAGAEMRSSSAAGVSGLA